MSKKIILLSDGTGNSAGKANKTNVWRMFRALDLQRPGQVAFYDDGVGSQEFLPLKLLGGAFGHGLKRNVIELYEFLCRNYKKGDKIYCFGFSRGAWTIRMLVGFIHICGIIKVQKNGKRLTQKDLHREAKRRYKEEYRPHFKRGVTRALKRKLRTVTRKVPQERKEPVHPDAPQIEFVGVWDTVSAYGMPVDELARLWDFLFYPLSFPDQKLSKLVKHACHALAIDDERKTFHPVLWDEEGENTDRIKQVWFAGAHSNVGGGYPKDELAFVTLDWMMSEVEALPETSRLKFLKTERDSIAEHAYVHGMLYNSRKGLSTYYRIKPRKIEEICQKGVKVETPIIHESVITRIREKVTPYAPVGIPGDYKVFNKTAPATKSGTSQPAGTFGPKPETDKQIRQRLKEMEGIWYLFQERIGLYRLFFFMTLFLLLFPPFNRWKEFIPPETENNLIGRALSFIGNLAPSPFGFFFKNWEKHPNLFIGTLVVFGGLMLWKKMFLTQTKNRSEKVWKHLK